VPDTKFSVLKGKSARLIITADAPRWYDSLIMRKPLINQLKKGLYNFVEYILSR